VQHFYVINLLWSFMKTGLFHIYYRGTYIGNIQYSERLFSVAELGLTIFRYESHQPGKYLNFQNVKMKQLLVARFKEYTILLQTTGSVSE
jgi:hypothetical protein